MEKKCQRRGAANQEEHPAQQLQLKKYKKNGSIHNETLAGNEWEGIEGNGKLGAEHEEAPKYKQQQQKNQHWQ